MQKRHEDYESPSFIFRGVLEAVLFAFLTGFPGITKSLVGLEISARAGRGMLPGDFFRKPINVIYVSVEGSFAKSHGPRFTAAGGDPKRFKHIPEVIWLPSEIDKLERYIRRYRARLCIIDPVKDHFDARVYSSPSRTSECLMQLQVLAERTNCTILGIDWPSKSTKKGDFSVSGNQAFTGKPRQIITVGRLSRDEWVIGVTKASDTPSWTGWVYTVESKDIGVDKHGKPLTPRAIRWLRPAKPSEVMRAREQANLQEDPNLMALLQFVSPGGEYETDDLVTYLNTVELIGKNKARKLLTSARDAGYLGQRSDGSGPEYKVKWWITEVGRLHLAMSDEEVEATMGELFPSMDPLPVPTAQKALPPASAQQSEDQALNEQGVLSDVQDAS